MRAARCRAGTTSGSTTRSGPRPTLHPAVATQLVAQPNEPIRVTQDVKAVSVSEPKPGVYVFDLGQNMVGWSRITVRGAAGATVALTHAEMLGEDGTVYTDNLRGAQQTDTLHAARSARPKRSSRTSPITVSAMCR